MTNNIKKELDVNDIMRLLPHRYPFLLVDRIRDIEAGDSAVGIKNVTINEPFFQGHFPGHPIMPGVLIVEGLAQTAGAITVQATSGEDKDVLVYFMTVDKCKFRKPVLPGDVLEYHVSKTRARGAIFKFDCRGVVNGETVAEAEISAMMREAD